MGHGVKRAASGATELLVPGDNVEGLYGAGCVRVLRSTAEYFEAAAWALERAEHQVLLLCWDLHGAVRVRRGGDSGDLTLYEALGAALERSPELEIRIAVWDANLYYKILGEWFQTWKFAARFGDRLRLETFETPPEASAHQKALVVDDQVAFVGGVDFAQSRWDTAAHRFEDERRLNPKGMSYGPFHDLQLMMNGEAAARVGRLVRERWQWLTDEALEAPPVGEVGSWWPEDGAVGAAQGPLEPDGCEVEVGLAQTVPRWAGSQAPIHEVERLWESLVEGAERYLYIESQYLSDDGTVDHLISRLREPGGPEIVVVTPASGGGTWPEQKTIGALNKRNIRRLNEADEGRGRFLAVCPVVRQGGEEVQPYIHAKCCVVDDRVVRIGSSNISSRSMGTDLELDCAVELPPEKVAGLRDELLGAHLGLGPEEIGRRLEACGGSLIEMIRGHEGPHTLTPVSVDGSEMLAPRLTSLMVDPERPYDELSTSKIERVRHALGQAPLLRLGAALIVGLALGGLSWWAWRRL